MISELPLASNRHHASTCQFLVVCLREKAVRFVLKRRLSHFEIPSGAVITLSNWNDMVPEAKTILGITLMREKPLDFFHFVWGKKVDSNKSESELTLSTGYWPSLHTDSQMPPDRKYPEWQESHDRAPLAAETRPWQSRIRRLIRKDAFGDSRMQTCTWASPAAGVAGLAGLVLSVAVVTLGTGRKAAALLPQVEEPRGAAQAVVLWTSHTLTATRVAPFTRPGVGVAVVTCQREREGRGQWWYSYL